MAEPKQPPKKHHFVRNLVLICLLLMIAGGGVAYAVGWVSIRQGDGLLTIEIRTGKARHDTEEAVKKSKDATVETGKALQSAGKKLEELGGDSETGKR